MGDTLSDNPNDVRLNFTIDRELHDRLERYMPWGLKAAFTRALLSTAADLLDKHGPAGLGLILAEEVELRLKPGTKAALKDGLRGVDDV
jgi:hypothetical protein